MKVVTKACSVVGLIMVGAMTASNVSLSTTLAITIEGTAFPIQDYIDQIFTGILPLGLTLFCMSRLKKGVSATKLIFAIYIAGILLSVLHIC
jgi:PTS system mannose-specific IID component